MSPPWAIASAESSLSPPLVLSASWQRWHCSTSSGRIFFSKCSRSGPSAEIRPIANKINPVIRSQAPRLVWGGCPKHDFINPFVLLGTQNFGFPSLALAWCNEGSYRRPKSGFCICIFSFSQTVETRAIHVIWHVLQKRSSWPSLFLDSMVAWRTCCANHPSHTPLFSSLPKTSVNGGGDKPRRCRDPPSPDVTDDLRRKSSMPQGRHLLSSLEK